jgi:hypothetical protein
MTTSPVPERGEKGEKGESGERGLPGESIKGDPGNDGKSVTADDVLPELKAELHKAIEAIPAPRDGKDGSSAYELAVTHGYTGTVDHWMASLRGKDGSDGRSVTPDEILPTVKEWFDALPPPANGRDGIDGKSVTLADVTDFMEASMAKWALEFERRASDLMQRCIDRIEKPKDGLNGKDGLDGLGFEDVAVSYDGARTFTVKFVSGDRTKEFPFRIPALLEQGVYAAGRAYEKGDGVTFQGSYWIAQTDTAGKPGESADWRLAVKKGRDGKDGEKGARGPEGPVKPKYVGTFPR